MEGPQTNPPSSTPPGAPDEELAGALRELIDRHSAGQQPSVAQKFAKAPEPSSQCPEPGEWQSLALGESDGALAIKLEAHAARCASCAERLRMATHLQSSEASPEEDAQLGRLASSTIDWQYRLAAQLTRTPRASAISRQIRPLLWVGSAAAAIVAGAVLTLWWQRSHSPERMLSEVYGRDRVFPLRMPGAAFAAVTPETHLRGGTADREPAELLEARARIRHHLDRDPADAHWLQLQARSEILEESFDSAIDILDRLVAANVPSPSLFDDAATAYFQRGSATGSENDRATALDYLRRADEQAPGDPVILFNEAVVMEDRGQLMNAVETWQRFLRFERDPAWLAEGRGRLAALEQKLNRLKTHRSRMEQHLATPHAMRALAADTTTLAAIDEELSTTLLPKLLYAAFPQPVERSRGSPCTDPCLGARTLLRALAASLEHNHQDPWLTRFLPADLQTTSDVFDQAAYSLGKAIDADQFGNFPAAVTSATESRQLFHRAGNTAGEDRAQVESAYALQRFSRFEECRAAAQPLLGRDTRFVWIRLTAALQDDICNTGRGTASEDSPVYQRLLGLARDHHYSLLAFRVWTTSAGAAVESGDAEETWRIDLTGIRRFYEGDYPSLRVTNLLAGPATVEQTTPRTYLDELLKQEFVSALEIGESRNEIPAARMWLAASAIRSGDAALAEDQMRRAQSEEASFGVATPLHPLIVESEIALADYYVDHSRLDKAQDLLDAANGRMAGDDNFMHRRLFAQVRGKLELALGHPEAAESILREAILAEERQAVDVGAQNVAFALQNHDLYAILAGIWLARHRPAEDILALWERYRVRILGLPVPACGVMELDCLKRPLARAVKDLGRNKLVGQIVLSDRVLLYQADERGVSFSSVPMRGEDLIAAAAALERAASSPASSSESIDLAATRAGNALFDHFGEAPPDDAQLLLEPDPLLGNLPWPAVAINGQPAGLSFNMEEIPSLLLRSRQPHFGKLGNQALIVGASVASNDLAPLPEAISEARDVGRFLESPRLLLDRDATERHVLDAIRDAGIIHFAGHAVHLRGSTRLLLAASGAPGSASYLDSQLLRNHPPTGLRLAVFSACSSGKRAEGWNHGMGDIVDTLAALGVPEVVATRWEVDSASAVPMMEAFYSGLAEGLSVSEALTRARWTIRRDARYRHPYYWASYYASGTGATDLREVIHGGFK